MHAAPLRTAPVDSRLHDPGHQRRLNRHRQMELATRDLIYSRPELVELGSDPLVAQMMSAVGFSRLDYHATRLAIRGKKFTAIVLSNRAWHDRCSFASALFVKAQALAERTRCILIPQRAICSATRGANARLIARSRRVHYGPGHVDGVLSYLHMARIATLGECAGAVGFHGDPVGVVLAMAARGLLRIEQGKPIDNDAWVTTTL